MTGELPPELQDLVLSFSSVQTLQNARKASRRLRFFATQRLSATITIQTDSEFYAWEGFKPIEHGKYVKQLKILTVNPDERTFGEWESYLQSVHSQRRNTVSVFNDGSHRTQAFELYKLCQEDIRAESQKWMASLYELLPEMKTLRKLVISDAESTVDPRYKNCSLRDCSFRNEDHGILGLASDSGLHQLGNDFLGSLMAGLSKAGCPIQHLVIESEGFAGLAYRNLIFDTPERMLQMRDLGNVLSNLTKLQMTLLIDKSVVCLPSGNILGPIARTLSTAKNLRCLNLEAIGSVRDEEDSLGNFGVVLSGCIFRNLISLKLEGFKCTVTELLRFTDGCSELQDFTLSTFELATGTWADAINHWKANLKRLTVVDLNRLAGTLGPDRESWSLEFEDCWVASLDEECLLDLQGPIEDFLVGNGSNPFSLAELRHKYGEELSHDDGEELSHDDGEELSHDDGEE